MPPRPRPTEPVGLYDPQYEHDACGVAFVARLSGDPSHETVRRAITALENLEHRGAAGADPNTGDGAGMLMQLPDELMRGVIDAELPPAGQYGVAVCFLPQDDERRLELEQLLTQAVESEGQRVVTWRDIPVEKDYVGITANWFAPYIKQLVVAASPELAADQDAFERKLYVIRRVAELAAGPDLVIPSFSSRTIVYKGMLTAAQLLGYYPDLQDERTKTALALVHSRFSTNTFPSWELAHPFRYIAHNGEINTLRGNVNWMRARESQLASELFGDDLQKVLPVVRPAGSDSATFDNVLELLVLAGRSLPHAMMMMVPEAWEERDDLPEHLRAFYAFHSCVMEPWDGPAAVCFTDGRVIGATLDRNGLRPGRWMETKDGWVVLASEAGVLDVAPENVLRKGRLQPGKLFLVDVEAGRIVEDDEVKRRVATRRPYGEWYQQGVVRLQDLPERQGRRPSEPLRTRQLAFGYTQEDLRVLLAPMAAKGEEPIGSMGNDISLAVLSDQAPPLFSYFKQLFAQVTNPPIDPIRESVVMSIKTGVGSEANLLDEGPDHAHQLVIPHPILRNHELESLRGVDSSVFRSHTIPITWPVAEGAEGMVWAVRRIAEQAAEAIAYGANIIVLSDRGVGPTRAAIPSLLAVAAVHHHLVREGTRLRTGLVLESGEPREVHHFATLIGYGASAINPYLMFESLADIVGDPDAMEQAQRNVVKAIGKGLLKTLSKMGISTIQSYNGAQIFEAIGLAPELVERHFTGHRVADRRHRPRRARARDAPAPPARLPGRGDAPARRRRLRLAQGRRAPPVEPGRRRQAPARRAPRRPADVRRVGARGQRGRRAARLAARPDRLQGRRADPALRGRARVGARQALRHRRDVARLALARGARDARDRHEPARRQVEHRRGRRGRVALHARPERRLAPLGDQAGRLRPLRRDDPLPHERRRDPDQDGPGREARRGRPAARPQGRRLHRQDPQLDARRRPDLAAAAPRHLLDRGPQAAHLRPALREPGRADLGEARGRGRRRHGGRGRREGGRGPHPHLGPRRRHGRLAALVAAGRRLPVGDRPGRDAADADDERPALARLGAGGRPDEDRPRRRDRRRARRRRGRLLHGAADRGGLHHDARLPPEHVPGRHRHAGPGAAPPLRGHAGARRRLPLLRRRGGARADGQARRADLRRPDRPRRAARLRAGRRPLEGARDRPLAAARRARPRARPTRRAAA